MHNNYPSPLFIEECGKMSLNELVWQPLDIPFGITITQSPMFIGSRLLNFPSIVIKQASISRRQARLFYDRGDWFLNDMGSANGCWFLQEKTKLLIDSPIKIEHAMLILLGAVVVEFQTRLGLFHSKTSSGG
jgi:pSer/pThr/pTyr-binding forkhead associated (FHA) protein